MIKTKIAIAKAKRKLNSLHEQAKRIALAVIIVQYMLAIGYYQAEKHNLLMWMTPNNKIITIYNTKTPTVEAHEDKDKDRAEKLADIIYLLESSNGKNDAKCERIGKHNGYGYNQGIDRNYCLDSDEAMREIVIDWIDRHGQNMNDKNLLCYYNTGMASNNCDYIQGIEL
jgi:hypothetical protein